MYPWDDEQTAVDALRESSAPAAATGGAGDWMTALPMLLGAGASLASPNMANAGNAVMQMGDYFRRQRMEDLSQQRYQQAVDVANRRAAADAAKQQAAQAAGAGTAQYLQGLGFTPPAGVTDPNVLARLFEVWQRQQQWQAEQARPRQERIAQLAPSLMTQYQTTEPAPEPMVKQADVQAWQPYAQHPATPLVQELVARGMPPTAENLAQFYGQDAVRNMPGGPKYGQERAAAFANQPGGYAYEKDRSTAELSIAIDALARAGVPMDKIPQILLTRGGLQNPRPGGETPEGIKLQAQGVPPGTLASRPDAAQIAQRVLDTDLARAIALEQAKVTALTPLEIAKARETARATGQVQQDLRQQEIVSDPHTLQGYVDPKTWAPPQGPVTRAELTAKYRPLARGFEPTSARITHENYVKMAKIIATHPEYWPKGAGDWVTDQANLLKARTLWYANYNRDPVFGDMAKIDAQLALHAKASGDAANISIIEQTRQALALAMQPGLTRERGLASVLSMHESLSNIQAKNGLVPLALDPKLEALVKQAAEAERRREEAAKTPPSTSDRRRRRGAATSSGDPLLDAATGVK